MAIARLQVQGPRPASSAENLDDAVELYQRTYSTLLRSSGETRLRVLEPSHRAMESSLHPLAGRDELDLGAFLYAIRRLPAGIVRARRIVMGQDPAQFARSGIGPLERVGAGRGPRPPAALVRRRRRHAGRPARQRVRRRRPRADARRIPDRVEQDQPADARGRLAGGRRPRTGAPGVRDDPQRRDRRLAAPPRHVGRGVRPAAARDRDPAASRCASGCSGAPRSATRA